MTIHNLKKFQYCYAINVDEKLLILLQEKQKQLQQLLSGFDSPHFSEEDLKLFTAIARIITLIDPNGVFQNGCASLYSSWMWAQLTECTESPKSKKDCLDVLEQMIDLLGFVLETGMAKIVKELVFYNELVEVSDDYTPIDDELTLTDFE